MNPREIEILLVEDDPADAELTVMALRKEGLANHIEVARDGAEALEFLFGSSPFVSGLANYPPRLILLDLKLPRISGCEVLKAIKEDWRTQSVPVVVLTSSNEERDLTKCYELGVNSYIQKPVDLQKFREVVRQLGLYWLVVNHVPPTKAVLSGSKSGDEA